MTLRDLRRALDRTQVRLARELGVKQETVSWLEKRSDMLLSTLRGYVEAMGGELDVVAKFPDRPPVRLKTLAAVPAQREPSAGKTPAHGSPTAKVRQESRRGGRLTARGLEDRGTFCSKRNGNCWLGEWAGENSYCRVNSVARFPDTRLLDEQPGALRSRALARSYPRHWRSDKGGLARGQPPG
jgi:transcriptional regulator with XRE-family HTH domain